MLEHACNTFVLNRYRAMAARESITVLRSSLADAEPEALPQREALAIKPSCWAISTSLTSSGFLHHFCCQPGARNAAQPSIHALKSIRWWQHTVNRPIKSKANTTIIQSLGDPICELRARNPDGNRGWDPRIGAPIPGKSGVGMGVDPRSPANRGWDPHPRSPANRG